MSKYGFDDSQRRLAEAKQREAERERELEPQRNAYCESISPVVDDIVQDFANSVFYGEDWIFTLKHYLEISN